MIRLSGIRHGPERVELLSEAVGIRGRALLDRKVVVEDDDELILGEGFGHMRNGNGPEASSALKRDP